MNKSQRIFFRENNYYNLHPNTWKKEVKCEILLKRGLEKIKVLSYLYCSLNKAKSISGFQHLLTALYPYLSLVGSGDHCCCFLNACQVV